MGLELLRALQHGNHLKWKVFRPIYLFKLRALGTKNKYEA